MKTINVTVRDKIASAVGDIVYICGNSDYVINFDFDAEWAVYGVKTARFVHNGTYTDVVFTGNQCDMPVIHKAYGIYVGVYAGDLRTTTPAHIPSAASILSADGTPAAPPDNVYAQITALCNEAVAEAKSVRNDADAGAFNGAPGKTPVVGEDYFTEADKQAIAAEAAQKVGFPQPTASDEGTYLGCKNGAATWMPVGASGGGKEWRLINKFTIETEDLVKIYFDKDLDGNPFELSEVWLLGDGRKATTHSGSTNVMVFFRFGDGSVGADAAQYSYPIRFNSGSLNYQRGFMSFVQIITDTTAIGFAGALGNITDAVFNSALTIAITNNNYSACGAIREIAIFPGINTALYGVGTIVSVWGR